ncbi:hypothetical protein [Paenibacillus arenosi]|uniref:BclA C-terminal domain-containing protein n=1 Tax=Paenibacillus arenosi TaxID=2774142 RepID=A0ABR9ATI7_9BACL|nr:hypothetical protein [Paenibacillus arenosi]MBD8497415.1 hypothetical protein [Paenibacillus arenosi]
MAKFLDGQISQNASYAGSISIPATTAPALFGTLGLNLTGAGPNVRVNYEATVSLFSLLGILTTATITVVRISGGVPVVVYTANQTLPAIALTTFNFTISGIDNNVPVPAAPGFVTYQAFISVGGLLLASRVGPESFSAIASSD